MEIDNYDHGVFSWVDVTATDFEASRKFYSELFGWEIERGPEEFGGYALAVVNGRNVAGISPAMSPEAPPVWSTYVDVASVDDTMSKAAAGGGHGIVEPMDVGEAGRMAMFADPEGAVIGLWEAKEHRGAGLVNEPNTWAWNELMCDEPKKAKEFYAGVFGWGEVTHGEGDNQYTEWQVGGRSIGGMLKKPADTPPMPSFWTVYIQVADIEVAAKRLSEVGGQVIRPPVEIEPGTFAVVTDPAGAMFNLFQTKE
jgi:hypothetical protein